MVIGKIKPAATIVAQFAGGVEVDAIQHEGKIYMPVMAMGEFATKEVAPKSAPEKTVSAPKEEKDVEKEAASEKSYTEDELMEMSTKELMKLCKEEFGIDPDDYEGKNTNKKLRNLILEAQENEGGDGDADADNDEGDDEDEAPKKSANKGSKKEEPEEADDEEDGDNDDLASQIGDILEDFDAGKKNKKKTIAAIVALSDDADEDKVAELVEKFESDEEADLDELAGEIAETLTAPKKETKKRGGKKSKKEEFVDPDDLEVGDRVSVWWDDDNQEWYDGTVKSKKKGKTVIAYDDDTEEALDPEVHTKIKKLAK